MLYSYADVKGAAKVNMPFPDVILDSGAYSMETGGNAKVNLEAYSFWLKNYIEDYPQIKMYVNLDDLSDPQKSIENLKYLESKGLKPIPVYHYGEPENILEWMCENYSYVGIGGIAVGVMPIPKLTSFWEKDVYEKYPETKFHIFGVGTIEPFFKHQPYSVDSTSWNVGAVYGDIMGYENGKPFRFGAREMYGYEFFFTREELFSNNIRAILDWEKLEWMNEERVLKHVKNKKDENQRRLL